MALESVFPCVRLSDRVGEEVCSVLSGAQPPLPPTGPGPLRGQNEHIGLVSIVPVWRQSPASSLDAAVGPAAGRQRREVAGRLPHRLCVFRGDGRGLGSSRLSAVCAPAVRPSLPFPGRISYVMSLSSQAVF